MNTHNDNEKNEKNEKPAAVSPEYFMSLIRPLLSKSQRQEILEAIMAQPGGMVRVAVIPDWGNCDPAGDPAYIFQSVHALPEAKYLDLLAKGAVKPHYFNRQTWRMALHCTKNASRSTPGATTPAKVLPFCRRTVEVEVEGPGL
jgi:hypothetical protein